MYDNKVLHEYVKKFSETIHDLFILLKNNDNTDSLNRSLLHLNKHGDRMHGGTFCSYSS